jgi:hypothetical protein
LDRNQPAPLNKPDRRGCMKRHLAKGPETLAALGALKNRPTTKQKDLSN